MKEIDIENYSLTLRQYIIMFILTLLYITFPIYCVGFSPCNGNLVIRSDSRDWHMYACSTEAHSIRVHIPKASWFSNRKLQVCVLILRYIYSNSSHLFFFRFLRASRWNPFYFLYLCTVFACPDRIFMHRENYYNWHSLSFLSRHATEISLSHFPLKNFIVQKPFFFKY